MWTTLRVLFDPALTGPVNMGRDEALLARVGRGDSPPTLRFYQWDPPTISLGYFQPYAEYEALPPPAGGLAVVRRPTGGGAILHDLELTYSISVPVDHTLLAGGPLRLYERMHDALIEVLASVGVQARRGGATDSSGAARGPFFCFARRHALDVLLGGDKVAGSAQRRTREAVLQHGSIVLANRFGQQQTAVMSTDGSMSAERLAQRLGDALASRNAIDAAPGAWSAAELTDAEVFVAKHASAEWLRRA